MSLSEYREADFTNTPSNINCMNLLTTGVFSILRDMIIVCSIFTKEDGMLNGPTASAKIRKLVLSCLFTMVSPILKNQFRAFYIKLMRILNLSS